MIQSQKTLKVRDSSMELLRVIAMVMIVFHHFAAHGAFEWDAASVSAARLWHNFILLGGKIGVNVFVFISGYYLINRTGRIKPDKIAKLVGQIFFYSTVIYLVFYLTGMVDIRMKSFFKAILPITFSHWWFASAYFVLFLLHPFLNRLLCGMEKSTYQRFLLVLVICWSVIPTFTSSFYQSNHLLWFITLYSISGYIRLYGLNSKFTSKHYCVFGLVCAVLTYATSVVFTILGKKWDVFTEHVLYFYGQERIPILCISLCLFMLFSTLKLKYHRWINTAASATFGVYLIHDHYILREFLWEHLFHNAQYQGSIRLIPYSIFVVAIVYVVCTFLELLRQQMVEKPFLRLINKYSERVTGVFETVFHLVRNFVFGERN